MRRPVRYPVTGILLGLLAGAGARVAGADPLTSASVSPDVTVELGATAQDTADEDVAVDDLAGTVTLAPLGTLPAASDLSAYEVLANGDQLLCFDTTVELPGPLTVEPGDVVRHGAVYSIAMDASANGVPPGVYCDAVTLGGSNKLLLSFDVSTALPPGGFLVDDEDLVRLDGAGAWSLYFDGSAAGVPAELDVDGAGRLENGNLAFSFDGSGEIGGVHFDDEDILEYDAAGPTWSLVYDGSSQDADWAAADVDAVAVPEPGFLLLLGAGIPALLVLGRSRTRW